MPNPQQPELRRSQRVPALDPDATEAVLSAEERPKTTKQRKKVPEDQQPGHHPDDEQDKPDMEAFADRLGIAPEGEEPDDAPRVEAGVEQAPPTRATRTTKRTSKRASRRRRPEPAVEPGAETGQEPGDAMAPERRKPPVKLLLLGPAVTYVGVRTVYRTVVRIVRRDGS